VSECVSVAKKLPQKLQKSWLQEKKAKQKKNKSGVELPFFVTCTGN